MNLSHMNAVAATFALVATMAIAPTATAQTWQVTGKSTTASYAQIIAYAVSMEGVTTPPTCPTGYTTLFSMSGNGTIKYPIYNVAGTRFTLGTKAQGTVGAIAFFVDSIPQHSEGNTNVNMPITPYAYLTSATTPWLAMLCAK